MQTVTLTLSPSNEKWIAAKVDGEQFANENDVINDLISKARELEILRQLIKEGEESGFITQTKEEILEEIKEEARRDGLL
jgi:antitoxin ParD1/3/4